jgi:putative Mg2+ transporter-C (MgtC) family protein
MELPRGAARTIRVDNLTFVLNVGAALLMGAAIGLERQFRQHPAGLRTNTLVCVGAALFVSLGRLWEHDGSRIAAQVVSGIGFLGGGVILREGMTVRGMNTAATLWCTAAIGVLCGAGFPLEALLGSFAVFAVLLCLRPVSHWIDARRKGAIDVETIYRVRVTCGAAHEAAVRTILVRHVNAHPTMLVQGISSQDATDPEKATVLVDIFSAQRNDRALEDLVARINIEPTVSAVRWERVG